MIDVVALRLLTTLALTLTLAAAVPAASQGGAEWYLRPAATASAAAAADGKSYATAWKAVAHVRWSLIQPDDVLYVCGLGHGPFSLEAGWSGAEGADVRIDGSCPRPDGSIDAALWIGGDPMPPFPSSEWSGPDAHGIFSGTYTGSATLGVAAEPNATELHHVHRLERGSCDASGPTNGSAWPDGGAFCAAKLAHGAAVHYKPRVAAARMQLYGSLLGVVVTTNNSDVTIENMRVVFGKRPLDVNGGRRVSLINNTLRWGSDKCIGVNSHAGHPGPHPGTQGMLITRNTVLDCACGLYTINQMDDPSRPFDNSMNSNDLVVSYNHFSSIDPFNYYGNSDTHAIGIQVRRMKGKTTPRGGLEERSSLFPIRSRLWWFSKTGSRPHPENDNKKCAPVVLTFCAGWQPLGIRAQHHRRCRRERDHILPGSRPGDGRQCRAVRVVQQAHSVHRPKFTKEWIHFYRLTIDA
jgi:hypothetical protein